MWMLLGWAMAAELLEQDWRVVNDTVMGGVSSGQVEVSDTLRFTGELSLQNNGGFVSIRSTPADLGLDDAVALRITLRGDGRTWDVTATRADVPLRAGSYRMPVEATAEVMQVELPLAAFRPSSFGRPVMGAPALDAAPGRITGLGFLLADKRPGPFTLEVLSIEAVRGDASPDRPRDAIRERLQAAIGQGVPAFNAGDPARCRDLYHGALTGLMDHTSLTAGERSLVADALERSATQPATEGAWTLRHAIDSLLAG